jgi:hypothetical protein
MILAETFDHSIFRQSLARTFATGPDGLLEQGFNATLEVALPKVHVVSPVCIDTARWSALHLRCLQHASAHSSEHCASPHSTFGLCRPLQRKTRKRKS